ncbi:MAG: sugar transferase [Hyphomicrobiaceae bacterium]
MLKRTIDLLATIPSLVVLGPVMLVIGILVRLDSNGPGLFRQVRVGRNGVPFKILKFRTMVVGAEASGPKVTGGNDSRITRLGRFLRRTKLDELPQILNVVAGDMSLVGPRPEVPEYVDMYPDDVRREVLSVRPGMTDIASIEFRDEASLLAGAVDHRLVYVEQILPRKLELQRQYVRTRSLTGDIMLILRTLAKVVRRGPSPSKQLAV